MKTSVVVASASYKGSIAPLQGTYDTVARKAAEIGFDAIQLTVNRPSEVPVQEVIDATQKYHLAVSSIATGQGYTVDGLSLGNKEESNRKAAVDRMKEHMDLAARFGGTRVVIGAIRGWARENGSWDAFEKQFRTSMDEMLPYAEKSDVVLILEANDHLETDAFLSVKETADFIQSYGSPHFLLQLDTMHMLYEKQNVYEEVVAHAPLIAQVDISDEDRMVPDGKHFDFPLLFKALKDINYRDYLVFEYKPSPPEDAAKVGFDYIKSLME